MKWLGRNATAHSSLKVTVKLHELRYELLIFHIWSMATNIFFQTWKLSSEKTNLCRMLRLSAKGKPHKPRQIGESLGQVY